jgi:hypothetical protein
MILTIRVSAPDIEIAFIFVSEPVNPYNRLINAVIQVESSGNTMALNITEKAFGAFQIRPIRLLDYNRNTGKKYIMEDCYNFEISKEIFLYYAMRTTFIDYETIARKWNGSGITTLDYWKKVCTVLARAE